MTSSGWPERTCGHRSEPLACIPRPAPRPVPRKAPSFPRLDPKSLPGPENTARWTLPNGIVLLVRQNHASPSVVLNGYVSAGAVDEDGSPAGLAHPTAGGVVRGGPNPSL